MNGYRAMKKSRLKEILLVKECGYACDDGWATVQAFTDLSTENDFLHPGRYYIVDCSVTIGSRHTISDIAIQDSQVDLIGHAKQRAVEGIFHELYGKIITDLVRYRYLVNSGQLDRFEATAFIDNMIKDLES